MSLLTQKTIKNEVKFQGVGLHTGKVSNLCIKSSEPDSGIVFKRIDLTKNNLVYPNFNNVSNTSLNTTISNEHGVKISTVEHLMGALFGLGIDNAIIEIDNEEVPILDGSAKNFIEKIISAGFNVSDSPIKVIKINKTTVLRVVGFKQNFKPTKVITQTYLFPKDIVRQSADGLPPAGFPYDWGFNYVDYIRYCQILTDTDILIIRCN